MVCDYIVVNSLCYLVWIDYETGLEMVCNTHLFVLLTVDGT